MGIVNPSNPSRKTINEKSLTVYGVGQLLPV